MGSNNKRFSLTERVRSFKYAFQGLKLLRQEHNAWIHLLAANIAVAMGFYFEISTFEWIAVVGCIGIVFAFEAMNTALERLADHVSPGLHKDIKKVKDLSAAAVLLVSIAALVIGLIIFLPKIFS